MKNKTESTIPKQPTQQPAIPLPSEARRTAILKALAAGVTPESGLDQLVVGRTVEIKALTADLDALRDGSASLRFLTGHNGDGKTFMLRLYRGLAIQEDIVVLSADLTVNHRLHDSSGRARALHASAMAGVYTKTCPMGNGLRPLLDSWISGLAIDGESVSPEEMSKRIMAQLRPLKDHVGGYEFAQVLALYYKAHIEDNPALQDAALRWLRAEYPIKTEARQELGVRRIISDEDLYGSLKLFAAFCRIAGYNGVLVTLDELSALTHRLPHARARQANVQVLLTIINECLQGGVSGLGFVFAGTPDALEDPDRGLFTVPALRSRLQDCAPSGYVDYASPVLRLEPLGPEELVVLLHNVRRIHARGDETKSRLPEEGITEFLERWLARFGQKAKPNPRDVLRSFISILNLLEQDPGSNWKDIVRAAMVRGEHADNTAEVGLANFRVA